MTLVLDKRDTAEKHPVTKGDTLKSIVDKFKGKDDFPPELSWEDIAAYNWATNRPREVTRALCERVGVEEPNAINLNLDPESLKLDPALGPAGTKEILVPKVWKAAAGLDLKKVHTLKVRQHKPAVAVEFGTIDRWFIPDLETCDYAYGLHGEADCADQVDCEVYGSNYCKLDAWNDGLPTFTPLPDVPVWKKAAAASARTDTLDDWKGIANCTEGLLGPGEPAAPHPLTVAFSPYTMVVRYYKKATSKPDDKKARIDLEPFWVIFDATTNKPKADSCKVKWKVKGTDRLKVGLLHIVDKDDAAVYVKPLAAGDLAKDAAKEFAWTGKHADGTDASAARMPYRVKIEAHTDIDEAEGLAIAAMQTEVRLYVHKDTHALDLDPYVAGTDKISLDLSIADLYHKTPDPKESDGKLWTKFELAKAGFHPGPVSDGATNAHFESAVKEFQRSVPAHPEKAAPFNRLTLTDNGEDNEATRAALKNLTRDRRRPWFGKPADRSDWTDTVDAKGKVTQEFREDPAFLAKLRDPAERLIVWVDDRNWYSDDDSIDGYNEVGPKIRKMITDDVAALGNKRGLMDAADTRVTYDAADIARPWIPFQADLRLLSKNDKLEDEVAAETDKAKAAGIRRAIGPLRVDWSFDEIEELQRVNLTVGGAAVSPDLPRLDPEVEATLAGLYHKERNRTRIALRYVLDQMKVEYDRTKDIKKTARYYNAPESCGGSRPADAAQYFSKPFGLDAESLLPYKAKKSARETVYTVVHDKLGQPEADFSLKRQGRAGVYFHPSRIAGDGYQVRAQVCVDKETDYKFPNLPVLKARYPKLPQAHSAKLRLWRKTSMRAYVSWSPVNTWTGAAAAPRANIPVKGPDGFRQYFTACHLHMVNEQGVSNAELNLSAGTLFDQSNYRALVKDCLKSKDPRRDNTWISLDAQHMWPWAGHNQFGIVEHSTAGKSLEDGKDELEKDVLGRYWDLYADRVSLGIVQQIEKLKGWMRGHVLVEFQLTPDAYYRRYRCKRCGDIFTFIQNATGPILAGNNCPTKGCGDKWFGRAGKLTGVPKYEGYYICSGVAAHRFGPAEEESTATAGTWDGDECPTCGAPETLSLQPRQHERYRCNACGFEDDYPEAGAPAARGSHENEACPCGCGGEMKSLNQALTAGGRIEIRPTPAAKKMDNRSGGVALPGLATSSMGNPLGVALNFLGDTDLWGHELGHTRYFEHTGNANGGNKKHQHDSKRNSTVNWAAIHETTASNKTWDRDCLMTYCTDLDNYDVARDMPCFCYKCVLKNRGWKLCDGTVTVPLPAGDLQDP